MAEKRLLRPKEVCKKLGISRTDLWSKTKNGELPKPVKLSNRNVAYLEHELDEYIDRLIATRDEGRAA